MKKILALVLALAMLVSFAACGSSSAPAADPVKPAEESAPENEPAPAPESSEAESEPEPAPEPAQDDNFISIENDDSHYVVTVNGVKLSYEYSGNEITGLEGYVDCGSAADALLAVSQYVDGSDPTITDVYAKGKYVVIRYTSEAWNGLDVESLKLMNDYLNQ